MESTKKTNKINSETESSATVAVAEEVKPTVEKEPESEKQKAERETANLLERNGDYLVDGHRFEEALDFLRRAEQAYKKINDQQSLARVLFRQGFCHENLSHYDDAIDYYGQSREIYKKLDEKENYGMSTDKIAKVHYWQGDPDKAIDEYEDAIAFGSLSSELFNNLAFLSIQKEDFTKARENLKKSIEYKTTEESAEIHISYNNLGVVDYIEGKLKDAEKSFEAGLERDKRPDDEDRSVQYAIFVNPEYKGEKFSNYRVFNDVNTRACLMMNLATVREAQKKPETVIGLIEDATKHDGEQPYICEPAGWIYLNRGDDKKALEYFKRALQFDSANEELKKVIELINPYINMKVGRNDPCPCQSGKKYKKCHGASV